MNAEEFAKHPELGDDYWGEHPKYTLKDWQLQVDDFSKTPTRLGYWEWVKTKLEFDALPEYEHLCVLAFTVKSKSPTGEDLESLAIRQAIAERVTAAARTGELVEAIVIEESIEVQ